MKWNGRQIGSCRALFGWFVECIWSDGVMFGCDEVVTPSSTTTAVAATEGVEADTAASEYWYLLPAFAGTLGLVVLLAVVYCICKCRGRRESTTNITLDTVEVCRHLFHCCILGWNLKTF